MLLYIPNALIKNKVIVVGKQLTQVYKHPSANMTDIGIKYEKLEYSMFKTSQLDTIFCSVAINEIIAYWKV